MSKIPKILYHGTTKARYELGIKFEGLRGDMPVHLRVDQKHHGYVYFCDNRDDAAFYALLTIGFDNTIPSYKKVNDVVNAGTILLIQTSQFKKVIEVDPERADVEEEYKKEGIWDIAKIYYCKGEWYRFKGDIPTKAIIPQYDIPVDRNSKNAAIMQFMASSKTLEEKIHDIMLDKVPKTKTLRDMINES